MLEVLIELLPPVKDDEKLFWSGKRIFLRKCNHTTKFKVQEPRVQRGHQHDFCAHTMARITWAFKLRKTLLL